MPSAPPTAASTSALTRRTTLSAAVTGAVVIGAAGCSSRSTATTAKGATATADLATDEAIVVDLVARLEASLSLLRSARRAFPALPLSALQGALRAHRDTLRGASRRLPSASPSPAPSTAPSTAAAVDGGTRDAALATVRADATGLQQSCLDAAVRAESGVFARLLASMGCGISQHLVALPR